MRKSFKNDLTYVICTILISFLMQGGPTMKSRSMKNLQTDFSSLIEDLSTDNLKEIFENVQESMPADLKSCFAKYGGISLESAIFCLQNISSVNHQRKTWEENDEEYGIEDKETESQDAEVFLDNLMMKLGNLKNSQYNLQDQGPR